MNINVQKNLSMDTILRNILLAASAAGGYLIGDYFFGNIGGVIGIGVGFFVFMAVMAKSDTGRY